VHSWLGSPKYPHGHGFIPATNRKFAGYDKDALTLVIVMFFVSSGWRNTSIVDLENSGSSSKNNAPL